MSETLYKPMPSPADYAQDAALPRLNLGLRPALLLVLLGGLAAMFLLSLAVGSVSIPLDQIITVLLGGEAERASWTNIVLRFRLPKATTAACWQARRWAWAAC
jgi:ABC-type Fe3+-siderophore transport system permease subunit